MNAKVLLLLAASLAFAGCSEKPAEKAPAPAPKVAAAPPPAAAPATPPPAPAETGKAAAAMKAASACPPACEVVITVVDECKLGPVTPDPLHVAPGTHVLKFRLDGPQKYSFDGTKGVTFVKPGAPFTPGGGGTPKVVVLTDKNDTPGEWKYDVNVTDGKAKCKLDPTVIND